MASISYSSFLQALGWAALNSLWQAGLLWLFYLVVNYLWKLSPHNRYIISVGGIGASFLLFCGNIFYFTFFGASLEFNFNILDAPVNGSWLTSILTSASVAYLVLLLIPIYRLLENWRFLQLLHKHNLQKSCIDYKLFVQKMSQVLGIKKQVSLYLSEFIHSPVTIGFIKPIILLPVASLNNLTLQQAEAVLLHELSHIRRYDYLVNIFITVIHTILYFNPFVKLFVLSAENSREESCDQMVLQFGYDKVSYASALLNLEKASSQSRIFAIGATGKSNFVQRIEGIIGLSSNKHVFKFSHIAGLLATLVFAFFMHAFFTVIQQKQEPKLFAFNNFANPFQFMIYEEQPKENSPAQPRFIKSKEIKTAEQKCTETEVISELSYASENPVNKNIIPVALNEVEASLTTEEKKKVKSTINLVKEVLITYEWNRLKESVPDGLTKKELELARIEYLNELNKINWKNLEENLKADYNNINWERLDANFEKVLKSPDCEVVIGEITTPLPPAIPNEQIQLIKEDNCNQADSIRLNSKKVIKL